MYICPVCRLPLLCEKQTLRCQNGHSFDKAKEGYYNLLLAQQKKSREPGDSSAMIQARRAFLQAGHYAPLANTIGEQLACYHSGQDCLSLADLGCGEGYYSATIKQQLGESDIALSVSGMDIAKVAVRYAAKRYPDNEYAVASTRALPYPDASFDALLSVFAPTTAAENLRVLKADGLWLQVIPGPRHLYQLKQQLYPEVRLHTQEALPEGFNRRFSEAVSFSLTLESDALQNLLQMTPHYWRARPEKQQQLMALERLTVEADFLINGYQPLAKDN